MYANEKKIISKFVLALNKYQTQKKWSCLKLTYSYKVSKLYSNNSATQELASIINLNTRSLTSAAKQIEFLLRIYFPPNFKANIYWLKYKKKMYW